MNILIKSNNESSQSSERKEFKLASQLQKLSLKVPPPRFRRCDLPKTCSTKSSCPPCRPSTRSSWPPRRTWSSSSSSSSTPCSTTSTKCSTSSPCPSPITQRSGPRGLRGPRNGSPEVRGGDPQAHPHRAATEDLPGQSGGEGGGAGAEDRAGGAAVQPAVRGTRWRR